MLAVPDSVLSSIAACETTPEAVAALCAWYNRETGSAAAAVNVYAPLTGLRSLAAPRVWRDLLEGVLLPVDHAQPKVGLVMLSDGYMVEFVRLEVERDSDSRLGTATYGMDGMLIESAAVPKSTYLAWAALALEKAMLRLRPALVYAT